MMMASALAELSHWRKDTSPLLMMMLAGVAGMCPFSCHNSPYAMMAPSFSGWAPAKAHRGLRDDGSAGCGLLVVGP